MPSVTIDAGVLAVPLKHGSVDDVHHYVNTLLDWSQLLREPWVAIYMSERASEALFDDELFPLRNQIRCLFVANGIVEYDVNTVATVVDRLLQLTPSFETYFSIRDVLTYDLTMDPDILQLCSGTKLQSDLARCVVLIAILRQYSHESVQDHSLILRRAPRRTVSVRALIHLLEHERTDLGAIPSPPKYFEGDVLVSDDFRSLIECLDEAAILSRASDNVGVETAIRIAVYKFRLASGNVPEWNDVRAYQVSRVFLSSFQGLHPTQQLSANLLRALVETLEETNMVATHWLRMGSGGDDPQRVRRSDQAKAWRRDVDRDYHLHYWICENGNIEIASVSFPHDNFAIPE